MGWDSPDQPEADYNFEPLLYFIGCTCEHEAEQHCWMKCDVEGCPCTGHWEE